MASETHDTIFDRLSVRLTIDELDDAEHAYIIGKYAHRWQKRRELDAEGRPKRYLVHLVGALSVLLDVGDIYDIETIQATILHDSIEDCKRYVNVRRLRRWFGETVARAVELVSKVPEIDYLVEFEAHGDWRVLAIKTSDRGDNVASLFAPGVDNDFRVKQITETRDVYLPLFDRMLERCPDDVRPGIARIIEAIRAVILTADAEGYGAAGEVARRLLRPGLMTGARRDHSTQGCQD